MKKRNNRFIDGRCLKKYYCKDCGKKISVSSGFYGNGRCRRCQGKRRSKFIRGENCSAYKDGRTLKRYYCIKCGKEINVDTFLYGSKLCRSCVQKGERNPNFKKKHSKKHRERISKSLKKFLENPENHPNWQGGISFEPYSPEFNEQLKEQIRKRDNYTCQLCGMTEEEHLIVIGTNLPVHHIDYNKKNCNEDNLIALCNYCHLRTNYNRNYWKDYFKQKIFDVLEMKGK